MIRSRLFLVPLALMVGLSVFGAALVTPPVKAQPDDVVPSTTPTNPFDAIYFMPNATGSRFSAASAGAQVILEAGGITLRFADGSLARLSFPGSAMTVAPQGLQPASAPAHSYRGNLPEHWRENVPLYTQVMYRDLYPGIDLLYFFSGGQLKSELIIEPGARLADVRIHYEGIDSLSVSEDGLRVMVGPSLILGETIPYAFEERDGQRTPVKVGYQLLDSDTYGFSVEGRRARGARLVIDPLLLYSTYLGGSANDEAWDVTTDYEGNTYVTGVTWSPDLPLLNPIQANHADPSEKDIFIARYDTSGRLVYATYYGGANGDEGNAIATDAAGNAYVTGQTYSHNLPVWNAWQPTFAGNEDAYVLKLDPTGQLSWATYLGGQGFEEANTVVVDEQGRVYVGGEVYSDDFPLINPWNRTTYGVDEEDGFISIFDSQGQLIYSTYISAPNRDQIFTITVDQQGRVLAEGMTSSPGFPVYAAIQPTYGGGWEDCFVLRLDPWTNTLSFATFLGGSDRDACWGIDFDQTGNIYISGYSSSFNFPTVNAFQPTRGGIEAGIPDVTVAKLDPSGTRLLYSTYLGGSGTDQSWDLVTDHLGHSYLVGQTDSSDLPTRNPLQPTYGGGDMDGLIAILSSDGSLVYASYRGGAGHDRLWGIALDGNWIAHVAGDSTSLNLGTSGASQPSNAGGNDAVISRFTFIPTPTPSPTPTPYASAQIGPEGGMLWLAYPAHLTVLRVPPNALSAVTSFELIYDDRPNTQGALHGLNHCFELTIGQPQLVTNPLQLELAYQETGGVIENTIDLYRLEAGTWVTSDITIAERIPGHILAWIQRPGVYDLLGETNRIYLPLALRR